MFWNPHRLIGNPLMLGIAKPNHNTVMQYADITEAETVATLDLEESADILPTTSPLSIIGEVFSHRDPFLEVWTPYTQEQSKVRKNC